MLHSDSNGYTNLPDVVQPSHSPTESNKGQSPSSKDGSSDVSTGRSPGPGESRGQEILGVLGGTAVGGQSTWELVGFGGTGGLQTKAGGGPQAEISCAFLTAVPTPTVPVSWAGKGPWQEFVHDVCRPRDLPAWRQWGHHPHHR